MHPMPLHDFHPAVRTWFERSFPSPTPVQAKAWPAIASGKNVLVAAPTGSGKTLTAFLWAIDELVREGLDGRLEDRTSVLYISPLKALSNDIEKNLQGPLRGIRAVLKEQGLPEAEIRVMVRTGDTTQQQRTSMREKPPHILVTTPESLYVLLTSVGGRRMLSSVRTVIIDEVHAMIGDKRGSHLSLSLERLDHLLTRPAKRIGLSATQKPVELVARFLVGNKHLNSDGTPQCVIIDAGHKRKMDLAIELPQSPLGAVMANEVWGEVYEKLVALIEQHKTTLIFVNQRRMCERLAFNLRERLGDDKVGAHHGSLSKEQRFEAETNLKEGRYKALVATASLELGIDIGDVDLVCQIGNTFSIAAFLQRVGRSGHQVGGLPKGRLFPLSRDEMVESVALFDAVRRSELDAIVMPERPIDILAQQMIAEVACDEISEQELYGVMLGSYPFRNLDRKTFDEVVKMLADGFTTRRGKRGAHIHRDIITGRLRARKGARQMAMIGGGAIPDLFDYDVIAEPENVYVGSLNEDFAIESMEGDVFQLGNSTWRILGVSDSKVRVVDAEGQPPSLPFWLGEAPGRTKELSEAVSRLHQEVSDRLGTLPDDLGENEHWKEDALQWLVSEVGVSELVADQTVDYLATAQVSLGVMPTRERLVMERFFDEAGDMHLVIHAPFGARMNRGWGLALRKRFCRNFNFELQAAATEDAIILSLGSTHSFAMEDVWKYLQPHTVRESLVQALLDAPMFGTRWRWNATCALAVQRRWFDKRVPPQLQRMASEDLVALVFPDQLACLENIVGEREVPEHPLVQQTIHDCLTEAMDIEELEGVIARIISKEVELVCKDLREPSPFSHEIINAKPYAFLDPAPLEERRTRAIRVRHTLDPATAKDLGKLDGAAVRMVREEAWPQASDADELYDVLSQCGLITAEEGAANGWGFFFEQLKQQGRAIILEAASHKPQAASLNATKLVATGLKLEAGVRLWVALERLPQLLDVYPGATYEPIVALTDAIRAAHSLENPLADLLRGRMEVEGPATIADLSQRFGLEPSAIEQGMIRLELDGMLFRGHYDPDVDEEQWCERRLLARIHKYTLQKLRREVEPVSPAAFMRFLFTWHGIGAENQPEGAQALRAVIEKMQGAEAPAVAWESEILPARLGNYAPDQMDQLCFSGQIAWGKLTPYAGEAGAPASLRNSSLSICLREDLPLFLGTPAPNEELGHEAQQVLQQLQQRGALFYHDLTKYCNLLPSYVEQGLAELVAKGRVSADGFTGLRALLIPTAKRSALKERRSRRGSNLPFSLEQAGRWWLFPEGRAADHGAPRSTERLEHLEAIARILLLRYGVIFRKLVQRERCAPPWRDLLKVLRRLEDRGELRGGRFVSGVWGEQFALPNAIPLLRAQHKAQGDPAAGGRRTAMGDEGFVVLSAADPLNLTGVITNGERVATRYTDRILYREGVPIAVHDGTTLRWLEKLRQEMSAPDEMERLAERMKRTIPARLRAFYGKGIG
ncbi:MAG: DEAD/DEAH box helicase [Flavobacteriales bacterium]|nr:DEAD/DEAH box helicase [Flavobacteriales bacterium]